VLLATQPPTQAQAVVVEMSLAAAQLGTAAKVSSSSDN
jgi:hypothetical protein